jgi:asparagine synthetase B (glutamine-hydrolysing)
MGDVFGSEITAILECSGIDDEPNRQAIYDLAAVGKRCSSRALLSGGIDSSLVSATAQAALNGSFKTFNVRFSEKEYNETWAAVKVSESSPNSAHQ